MVITQEELIKEISDTEDINVATVREIFRSAENIIFDHLSSTSPSEKTFIKVLNGLTINGQYVPKKIINRGMFKKIHCPSRVKAKAVISEYYNRKLNGYFDE